MEPLQRLPRRTLPPAPDAAALAHLPPQAKALAMDVRYPRNRRSLVWGLLATISLHAAVIAWALTPTGVALRHEVILYLDMSQHYEFLPVPPRKGPAPSATTPAPGALPTPAASAVEPPVAPAAAP